MDEQAPKHTDDPVGEVAATEHLRLTRRRFLQLATIAGAAYVVPIRFAPRAYAAQSPQTLLAASKIPQFVDPLPMLHTVGAGSEQLVVRMLEFQSPVMPSTWRPAAGSYSGTWVWGYRLDGQPASAPYIGPVIVAQRNVPTEVKWVNQLGDASDTNVLGYRYSTDQTLHWADPLNNEANMWNHMSVPPSFGSEGAQNYTGPVPACVHLHGGEVPPQLDGGPDAWFTSDGNYHGHAFYSKDGVAANYSIYRYPNAQEAAAIWFHDHTLGATRLNVFAGLAGGYLVEEPGLLAGTLPSAADMIPLVLQDRSFDTSGQFFMPADSAGGVLWSPNPEHPYWVPEFTGDVIVVNGKVWPYVALQRRRYRFLAINGSNARTYEMFLTDPVTKVDGPPMWVIATDGGYLDNPVKIDPASRTAPQRLVMMPGERYQLIIDFNDPDWNRRNPNFSGTLLLRNIAKTPYPAGATPSGATSGRILQIRLPKAPSTQGDASYDPRAGTPLRSRAMVRLSNFAGGVAPAVTVAKTRQLTLNEVMGMPQTTIDPVTGNTVAYPGGPLEILVNNTKWDGRRVNGVNKDTNMYTFEDRSDFTADATGHNDVSELPEEGTTEIWEIVNLTADAHPIHLHLVDFQLVNRQGFNTQKYRATYAAAFPGGGYDPTTQAAYPASVYIPGFGPPLDYLSGNSRALGGNPDITPFLQGPVVVPEAYEVGWKDTVTCLPAQVTRIVVRWAPTHFAAGATDAAYAFSPDGGHGYVWHCHIIDHEDNEMMRPMLVNPRADVTRTQVKGIDY